MKPVDEYRQAARRLDEAGFVRKYGATWSSGSKTRPYQVDWEGLEEDCHAAIRFDERAQEGVEQNYTYHVDRARFDQALLEHAASRGATVRQDTRVEKVDFEGEHPVLAGHLRQLIQLLNSMGI